MNRNSIALAVLIFSTVGIVLLALSTILQDPTEAKDIFNVILPVFSSWVGTILAFYFGRENFESANQQVRELVEKLTPQQRAKASVTSIMRRLVDINYFTIPPNQGDENIQLSVLFDKFRGKISRLPILESNGKPKYMIHQSRFDRYLSSGGNQEDTLQQFIDMQQSQGLSFDCNNGFVVVSEQISIVQAKLKMESVPSCQDIFVTKEGSLDEPLTGWISNVRLAKFLEA